MGRADERKLREFLAKPPICIRGLSDQDISIFMTAFTHDSYSNELDQQYANSGLQKHAENYERLEFLGDAILEFLVCERVFHNTEDNEGNMTLFKQDRVANTKISERVINSGLNIDNMIKVSKGTEIVENIRADCFEALLAAIYLTRGLNEVRRVVDEIILV